MMAAVIYMFIFGYALFDAQTLVNGTIEGVKVAIFVVVPSLFPFIFLSGLFSSKFSSNKLLSLRPLEKLCGMPLGSGNLLILGLCGGYPVGAQCVANAYEQGAITKKDGQRLLGFCNNAGPSFIFGMVGGILGDIRFCWFLWLGQIFSALSVGMLLPGKSKEQCRLQSGKELTVTESLENTIRICAKIAGWVVLFRALLSVADKWFLHLLPIQWNAGIAGILELSNGCVRLQYIESNLLRYLLCGVLLSFGGLCVNFQTKSVARTLSLKWYFIGKILQSFIILPILLFLWKITVAF